MKNKGHVLVNKAQGPEPILQAKACGKQSFVVHPGWQQT